MVLHLAPKLSRRRTKLREKSAWDGFLKSQFSVFKKMSLHTYNICWKTKKTWWSKKDEMYFRFIYLFIYFSNFSLWKDGDSLVVQNGIFFQYAIANRRREYKQIIPLQFQDILFSYRKTKTTYPKNKNDKSFSVVSCSQILHYHYSYLIVFVIVLRTITTITIVIIITM